MNRKIKTIVVEDEPLPREGLLQYITEMDFLEVVSSCENALEANRALTASPVDLMFLDIQMPKITGLEFLKSIKNPPMVIITTAYPNFALQGYELDVVDYLVKPFSFDRFLKAANKAHDLFQLKESARHGVQQDMDMLSSHEFFFIKCDYRYEKIHFEELLYVEAMENYSTLYTSDRKYVTLLPMKKIADLLPSHLFLRIHKSYITSLKAIVAIDGNEVVIAGSKLPVSREKKTELLQRLVKK